MYFCKKCENNHREDSSIGIRHYKYVDKRKRDEKIFKDLG